jgi:branched chain amino acid efflux pump
LTPASWREVRGPVLRRSLSVGVATGTYGLSFGALATASGLDVTQACALSLLTFSGGSQFALIGVLAAGGNLVSGTGSAVLLGVRNMLYGARLAGPLSLTGAHRLVGAQLVIDESTAVALGAEDRGERAARLGFWATGTAVFVLWNLATLIGAVAGTAIGDPKDFGLDAAVPAAFIALVAPRLRGLPAWATAAAAAVVALGVVPFVATGAPVLLAALVPVLTIVVFRERVR